MIFACFTSICAFAQLPKTIFNCTFAKSTPTYVMNNFKQKGFEPNCNDEKTIFVSFINENHPNIDDYTPQFCGTWWHSCMVKFDDGVMNNFFFQNTYKNLDFAKTYYDIVYRYLQNNYSQYYWKSCSPITKVGYKEVEGVYYNSGQTYYKLFYGESNGTPFLILQMYYR